MNAFAWALAGFVFIHIGVAATGLRAALIKRIGEGPYRGLFSLVSLALLATMLHFFAVMRADPFDALNASFWVPPLWLRAPAMGIIALGVVLAVAGLFTPGPTFVGFEKRALAAEEPARGVLRITRHPFLWGVALWGAGHLMANGERFAVMLFGALTLMVVFGARSIDRKGRARDPEGWARFEAVTSNAPFAAIAQGRNRIVLGEMWWRLLLGVAAVGAIVLAHGAVVGVALVSTAP